MAEEKEKKEKKGFNFKVILIGLPLFVVQLVLVYFVTATFLVKSAPDALSASDSTSVEEHEEEGEGEEPPFRYLALEIVSPADDEPIRENAGNITVITNLNPRLQRGHVARLLMDGDVVQEGPQASFSLANVDRGTHTISVEIVNESGEVLIRSGESTFHLLRFADGARPGPAG